MSFMQAQLRALWVDEPQVEETPGEKVPGAKAVEAPEQPEGKAAPEDSAGREGSAG
jgi:hypothetical protein